MRAFVREQLGAIPLFHGVDPDTYEAMLPLFDCLDGKTTEDYAQRVEPSVQGGRKIAAGLLERLYPTTAAAA